MTAPPERDPLAPSASRPTVSTVGMPIGAILTMTVQGYAEAVQGRDIDTNAPDVWEDGNPKMNAVIPVLLNGEERSLWSPIPSQRKQALSEAQAAAIAEHNLPPDSRIGPGWTIHMKLEGEEPNKNPRLNPKKIWKFKCVPGTNAPDPFNEPAAAQQAPQQAPAAPAQWTPPPAAPAAPQQAPAAPAQWTPPPAAPAAPQQAPAAQTWGPPPTTDPWGQPAGSPAPAGPPTTVPAF